MSSDQCPGAGVQHPVFRIRSSRIRSSRIRSSRIRSSRIRSSRIRSSMIRSSRIRSSRTWEGERNAVWFPAVRNLPVSRSKNVLITAILTERVTSFDVTLASRPISRPHVSLAQRWRGTSGPEPPALPRSPLQVYSQGNCKFGLRVIGDLQVTWAKQLSEPLGLMGKKEAHDFRNYFNGKVGA